MEFRQDGDNMGRSGGNDMMSFVAGSMMNRGDDKNNTSMIVLAAIMFVIIFIIAIVVLVVFARDNKNDRRDIGGGTDIAAILATMVAAKGVDSNGCKDNNFDMMEIKAKLEHNEDRATARETQQIISQQGQSFMQLGFGLSNQIKDSEKDNLKEFGEIKAQLGMQNQALQVLLTKSNNSDIINGVIQQLTMGTPRMAC